MDQKLLYAFRGWIGFVAFMDVGTAIRCFNEKRSFFGPYSYSKAIDSQYGRLDDPTLPRILGYYCVLKALALSHCTLFIHYKPAVSMGISSLALALIMYVSEVVYYQSTTFNFYVAFPCVLNALTLLGLLMLPKQIWEFLVAKEDENEELLRQVMAIKRRKHNKKET